MYLIQYLLAIVFSPTLFFRNAIYVGGGGGGVSSNRGIAGRNQTLFFFFFFFRFQKGGGAHVQKGGAFIEKCFKRGGGARAGCAPPKNATDTF